MVIIEHVSSRGFRLGKQSGSSRVYKIIGSDDEQAVRLALLLEVPLTDEMGHLRMTADAKPKGNGVWEATVEYGLGERESASAPGENSHKPNPSDSMGMESSFDTTGGTEHITQSLATLDSAKKAGDARGFVLTQQGIGLSEHGVAGVDVIVPKLTWTETWKFPIDAINWQYATQICRLTGKVNNAKYRNFDVGEVLFAGASGQPDGQDKYRITFNFHASPNRLVAKNLGIVAAPGFPPVSKYGWNYLWVAYEQAAGGNPKAPVPRNVFVEQVYETDDLTKIGIGS